MALLTGPFAALSNAIDVSIEGILDIAKKTMTDVESDIVKTTQDFRTYTSTGSAFSEYPLAKSLAQQHEAALEVFQSTVAGVIADLQLFQEELISSANAYSGTDDAAAASLAALSQKFDTGHKWASDHNWNQTRQEVAADLGEPQQETQAEDSSADSPDSPPSDTEYSFG